MGTPTASRLTTAQLRQLLADDGRPAWPATPADRRRRAGAAIEVDRLAATNGLIGLGRRHPVGSHFAGRRLTVRLNQGLLQLVDQGDPAAQPANPLTRAEQARLRDAGGIVTGTLDRCREHVTQALACGASPGGGFGAVRGPEWTQWSSGAPDWILVRLT
jgi:hypothetical protein